MKTLHIIDEIIYLYLYRENEIGTLALFNYQVDVAVGQEIVGTFDQRPLARIGRHVRNQNAVVDVDEDQSHETPGPRHQPDLESIIGSASETAACSLI